MAFAAVDEGGELRLSGDFDIAAIDAFQRAVSRLIDTTDSVTIDLSGLEFIDSSGLKCLVGVHNRAADEDFTYALRDCPAGLFQTFQRTGLDRVLRFA